MLIDRGVFWRGTWWRLHGADDSTPPPGQTPPDGGQEPPQTPPAQTPPASQEPPKTFDAEYVSELRKEAAANRKKAAELEARLKEHEDKQLSETERLQKRASELEAENERLSGERQERLTRAEIRVQASDLGFADTNDAWRLLDASAIQYDDDGEPTNVKKLLEELLKSKPYLAKATNGTTPLPGTPRGNGQPQTREQLIEEKTKQLRASGSYSRL